MIQSLGEFTEYFQFPQLFQTWNTSHRPNYGSKGIWAFSRQDIVDARIFPGLGIESHTEKISKYKITSFYNEHFRI